MAAQQPTATHEIQVGDRVEVHIESPANPFSDTQKTGFDVTEVFDDKVYGVDPDWGDHCEIIALNTDEPHFADAGKSGDCVRIETMETTDDDVTIYGSGTVHFEREA